MSLRLIDLALNIVNFVLVVVWVDKIARMLKVLNLKLRLKQLEVGAEVSGVADSVSFLPMYAGMNLSILTIGKSVGVVNSTRSSS